MPLQNSQFETIMRDYSKKQSRHQRLRDEHRRDAYVRFPRLKAIEEEIASLSADTARSLLLGQRSDTSELRASIAHLVEEQQQILADNQLPPDYLDLTYDCPECQDTGFVDGKKCLCFRKAELSLLYAESNLQEILQKENFQHFSFDYYSATMRNETTGLTERQTAKFAYDAAQEFVRTFDDPAVFQNLFLFGDTGVGKSFLSHCIAHELLESAHYVLYFSAFDLFDLLAGHTFRNRDSEISVQLIYDCDLLIIDDLGTELTNSFVSSQLFLCINERLLRKKSTIISTNLPLQEFSDTYSERIFSRIASSYTLLNLIGKDIRIQKKITGGY